MKKIGIIITVCIVVFNNSSAMFRKLAHNEKKIQNISSTLRFAIKGSLAGFCGAATTLACFNSGFKHDIFTDFVFELDPITKTANNIGFNQKAVSLGLGAVGSYAVAGPVGLGGYTLSAASFLLFKNMKSIKKDAVTFETTTNAHTVELGETAHDVCHAVTTMKKNGENLGTAVTPCSNPCIITEMSIAEQQQKKGYGTQLWRHMGEQARLARCIALNGVLTGSATQHQAFFEKRGAHTFKKSLSCDWSACKGTCTECKTNQYNGKVYVSYALPDHK